MQGNDVEHAYLLQRFYCIALVALLEQLKDMMKIEVDRIARLAFNVGVRRECHVDPVKQQHHSPHTSNPALPGLTHQRRSGVAEVHRKRWRQE